MIRFLSISAIFLFLLTFSTITNAQYCDSLVPTFNVDLSASATQTWLSPSLQRDGSCCGSVAPDVCLEFVITLHQNASAILFDIASGAIPPGALFYQIDCGPITPVGDPICLNGAGPHTLTFCKPGNNQNTFSITSFSEPIIGPDITLNTGCQGFMYVQYYNEPSVSWTSIAPGNVGDYDNLLSCNLACDTTYITAPNSGPAFVDYLVCGMDAAGCNVNPVCDTIRVNFIQPVAVAISGDTIVCPGVNNITLNSSISGGTAPYSILWSTSETSASIIAGPGVYSVQVTDTSGCFIAADTVVISTFTAPIVDAGPDQILCEGPMVTLSASGALNYIWDNGVTNNIAFAPSLGTVNYTVIGTDVNGCSDIDQVSVTMNALPVINAGADQEVCENTQITISGTGAINYVWDNGVSDGVPFTPVLGATLYTVVGTDANGCMNTDQLNVLVNPLPIVNAGNNQVLCQGPQVVLSASGATSYTWNNGVINNVGFVPNIGTTMYTVTGVDPNGCSNIDSASITVNPLPVVIANSNDADVCVGQSVTLNGGGAVSYNWNNGVVDGISFVPPSGVTLYSVVGTDANGCVNTDQISITVFDLPVVVGGNDVQVCDGVAVTLSGSGATTYAWSNGVFDNVPFVQAVGTINYTLVGTDVNGCTSSDQVQVIVNALPNVNAGQDQHVCDNSFVTLNGSGANTYVWNNSIIDGVPFVPVVGVTSYNLVGTDANGCVNSDIVTVTVFALPSVLAGPDQKLCDGESVVLSGSGANAYLWTGGILNNVSFVPSVGIHQFIVSGTDQNACVNTDTVEVVVNSNPIVNAGLDQFKCDGEEITLHATGATNVQWNNGVVDNVSFIQSVGVSTYIVTDILSTGCTDSDTVVVEVYELPIVSALSMDICEGQSAILNGEGAVSYVWSAGVIDGVAFYPQETSNYTFTGTDANGCSDSSWAKVVVISKPTAYFTLTNPTLSTSTPTTSFNNDSQGAILYEWSFSDFTSNSYEFEPEHTFPDDQGGVYKVSLTVESEFGCVNYFERIVVVEQDYSIFVPNAFTPDANGVNEVFTPVLRGFDEQDFTLYIFNRWGQLVFESHDMNAGWNGEYSGGQFGKAQDGEYSWKISAKVKNSAERKQYLGHVALLK